MNKHIGAHMSHCFQGEYQHTCKYGDDENCPAKKLEKPFTKKIEIEESAIDTLRVMVQKLQDDNAELLKTIKTAHRFVDDIPHSHIEGYRAKEVRLDLLQIIAKHTTEPKVMA